MGVKKAKKRDLELLTIFLPHSHCHAYISPINQSISLFT